jgi:Protein of unknown function (DUF3096)
MASQAPFSASKNMLEPDAPWRVIVIPAFRRSIHRPLAAKPRIIPMVITTAHITPLVALIAGILILVVPRLLNYIVALYLIFIGLVGFNGIYHFVH